MDGGELLVAVMDLSSPSAPEVEDTGDMMISFGNPFLGGMGDGKTDTVWHNRYPMPYTISHIRCGGEQPLRSEND